MKTKNLIILGVAITAIAIAIGSYAIFRPRPSKVALVNFPSFMVGRMIKSIDKKNAHAFLETNMTKHKNYDAVLLWGMGGEKWGDEGRKKIIALDDKKIPYCVVLTTNPQDQLSNLSEEEQALLRDYVLSGGARNYKSLFNYVRKELIGKKLREGKIEEPYKYGENLFYGKTDNDIFNSYEEYQTYYRSHGFKEGAPKVAVFISFADPVISNREHIDTMVEVFEKKGMNIYPFSSGKDRFKILEAIAPDLVVVIPHGRITTGSAMESQQWLKEHNIPFLSALPILSSRENWEKDPQGLFGGMLSQSVASPEFDGVILPYALFSLEKDERSDLELFQAMPDRLDYFSDIVANYIALQKKTNAEKRVAIFYFKGPGQNSLVAQGIEVMPSLYNLLKSMKENGYNLTGLPDSEKEFAHIINEQGAIFNSYAEGAIDNFAKKGYPALISADSLNNWISSSFTEKQQNLLKEKYGKAPGDFFTIEKDGKENLMVTRVQFGNVVLLPQPAQTTGINDFKAIHGSNPIPPYPYIGAYLWVQKEFKADVLTHFGTHGSLEFIPSKQIALSSDDWTDRLVGTLPHVYYYTIANVGESMMAKRRSYATTVTYLNQPFIETNLREGVSPIQRLMDQYLSEEKENKELSLKIKKVAVENGFHRDLRLDSTLSVPLTRDEIQQLSDFVEEIAISKIPGGLYTTGIPFSEEKILSSVRLMSIDPIAYALSSLDIQKGKITESSVKDERFFTKNYRSKARNIVENIIRGGTPNVDVVMTSLGVSQEDIERAKAFSQKQGSATRPMMMGNMSGAMRNEKSGNDSRNTKPSNDNKKEHPHKIGMSKNEKFDPEKAAKAGMPKEAIEAVLARQKSLFDPKEQHFAATIETLKKSIENVSNYLEYLRKSPQLEMASWTNALNGGYIAPSPGGDYIGNPQSLPTGRNLYAINAEATPSDAAWKKGMQMAKDMLADYTHRHNELPKKVSFTLWSSSFIESEGATIAEILYLVGCEPVRDPMGRIQDVRLIPRKDLGRKRIDVVVQTSGQFRDLAASRLYLIQKAIDLAASAKDENDNEVKKGVDAAEKMLLDKGLSPHDARALSSQRVFGGLNGAYGTGIQEMVEAGDKWEKREEIADVYMNNMGAVYADKEKWSSFTAGLFEAALQRTDVVVQPRQSNTWGPLSLDHVYEFMGGLTLSVQKVTGKDPEGYFNDLRNHNRTRVTEIKQSIGAEARTTILNPTYVKEVVKGGATAASDLSETIRNTYGWNVMKPSAIDKELWDEIYETYVVDKHRLGVHEFFDRENPAALQELTAVMLETIRKGMWKASSEQIKNIASMHEESIAKHGAGCSGFVCDNAKLRDFISDQLPNDKREGYKQEIKNIRSITMTSSEIQKGQRLKKEGEENKKSSLVENQRLNYRFTYIVVGALALCLIIVMVARRRKKK